MARSGEFLAPEGPVDDCRSRAKLRTAPIADKDNLSLDTPCESSAESCANRLGIRHLGLPVTNAPLPQLPSDAEKLLGPFDFARIALRRWRPLVFIPFGAVAVALLARLILTPIYAATTALVPESSTESGLPAGIAGLAGQFGIALGGSASQSGAFYAMLVRSPAIARPVLAESYRNPRAEGPDSLTLLAVIGAGGTSARDSIERAEERLRDIVNVSVDRATEVVTVEVSLPFPELAAEVANRIVRHLNDFNARVRQSRARDRRRFVEERLHAAELELRAAEEVTKEFLEQNRTWNQSPQLSFEHDRLTRRAEVHQGVVHSLRQEFESARIAEVNDTPVITVLYSAVPPERPEGPRILVLVLAALVAGSALSIGVALFAEYWERQIETHGVEYDELRRQFGRLVRLERSERSPSQRPTY
jgi:uncharacterized protein involved in exopolysaccharide biosynthesis